MRQNVQEFATSLLDQTRTSHELEVMLNFNPLPGLGIWEPGDRQSLDRLKLAISYKQKQVRIVCLRRVNQLIDKEKSLLFFHSNSLWLIQAFSSYSHRYGTMDCPDFDAKLCPAN